MKMKMRNFPGPRRLLVVEPDYLPDSEVFYFQPCLYPMKYLHPKSMYTLPRRGVQRGGTPSAGSGGAIPLAGGSGRPPAGVRGKSPRRKNCLFMDKFVSADTDQSPQDPPGSGTNRDRILLFP
jgi:hypothetical protein